MSQSNAKKSELVLIADDNEPTRELLAAVLKKEGYDVMQAVDGGSAIRVAREHNVSCALIDQYMEPEGGFQFAHHVEAYDLGVPMILITAHQTTDLLSEATKAGFAQVLQKPIDPARLLKTVQMTVARGKD